MGLTIGQILAVSYNDVINEKRTPANQWAESALMRAFERQGFIKKEDMGNLLEWTLDYQRNPGTVIQTTDLQPLALSKTEVLTAGTSDIAEVSVPITWSRKDEIKNPSRNQKVAFVKSLLSNGIESHDDILEQSLFVANTNGFFGIPTHITTAGTGSDEGIDSSVNTFWRNQTNTYVDDTDVESAITTTYNQCAKGSGAKLVPTLLVSDAATHALVEGTQQSLQRWTDGNEANMGFKVLKVKNMDYVFSQYGGTTIYLLNPRNFQLIVSKAAFRDLSETMPLQGQQGFYRTIYTACQTGTNNRSRLGCVHL